MTPRFNRRSMLRGAFGAAAVGVALPLMDRFLNESGLAYADGTPIPTRFGTYFWGLGLTPGRWAPSKMGAGYESTPELAALDGLRDKVSVFSGFRVLLDGKPNNQHWTGQAAVLTGQAPDKLNEFDRLPSFDTAVASAIGGGSRFRSIEATPFGNPKLSYSTHGENNFATAEATPLSLYMRLFATGFQDPNSANWRPDPKLLLKRSVLSTVNEERAALVAESGAADRARIDQYFTSVREMENQLAVELHRPQPCASCKPPAMPKETARTGDVPTVSENNRLMAKLMAMALACNQTKVFNVVFTGATSELYLPHDFNIYHQHTHEESVDEKLGYQPISSKLAADSLEGYADFLKAMDEIKEGDGTLLDHSLVLGFSDTGYAKIHSVDNIPMLMAGRAGGRLKSGRHVAVQGDPVTRVVLTAQQAMGMPVGKWGAGAMQTEKACTEVLA